MRYDFLSLKKEMFRNFYFYTYVFTLLSIMLKVFKIMPNMKHINSYYESNFKDDIFVYYCLHPIYVMFKYIKLYIDNTDKFFSEKLGGQLIGMYIEHAYKFTLNSMFFIILYNVFELIFNCRNTTSKPLAYYVLTIIIPSAILLLLTLESKCTRRRKKKSYQFLNKIYLILSRIHFMQYYHCPYIITS